MGASWRGGHFLAALRAWVGARLWQRSSRIVDREGLRRFIEMRASFVAQTALYGYLRTRAGLRYPVLYENDSFTQSVNIAKWHVWLACLSDLCVFTGGLLASRNPKAAAAAGALMGALLEDVLAATGIPVDAGPEFPEHARRVRARLALCNWTALGDDAAAFSESAPALVHWSPIADELKRHDEAIVRNSIRFLWQEVRRNLRSALDVAAVMAPPA